MNPNIIEMALANALSFLQSELESVCNDDLKEDYQGVIIQIENALIELKK